MDELNTLEWKDCSSLPLGMRDPQCILFNNKVYVGGGATSSAKNAKLFVSDTNMNSWSELPTPTYYHAITTFCLGSTSYLVLIGGMEASTTKVTNKLWLADVKMNWKDSVLPAMPTKRYWSSAISTGKYIIVAGGRGVDANSINTVSLLYQKQWLSIHPLPERCSGMKSIIHDGCLYLMGGYNQPNIFYCKLDSLLDSEHHETESESAEVWRQLNTPLQWSSPSSFGNQLLSTGGKLNSTLTGGKLHSARYCSHIYTYSFLAGVWLHLGNMPLELNSAATIILPTGELAVIGGERGKLNYSPRVFKASLKDIEQKYWDALCKIIAKGESIDIRFAKMTFVGPPRLGKTTTRRRLTGEIVDISSAGEPQQPSTGTVESGQVFIRDLSETTAIMMPTEWTAAKTPYQEASFYFSKFFQLLSSKSATNKSGRLQSISDSIPDQENTKMENSEDVSSTELHSPLDDPQHTIQSPPASIASSFSDEKEAVDLFREVMNSEHWKYIKYLFHDATLLRMEDTGGQPEFMDMLPALTIGPALYMLFCRLIDDFFSHYAISYCSESSETTPPVESTYTVEEVFLNTLSSIACSTSQNDTVSPKSVAYVVATYKDQVSEQQIAEFDQKVQESLRSTDFFKKDLIQFSSKEKDRMILPIDNLKGGEDEVKNIREFLEDGIKKHFEKLRLPVTWLILSLCLRSRSKRISSLESCQELAKQLGISPNDELKLALEFLHQRAGVLMYFPTVPELQDIVICDVQIVYDSVTNLIVNTFRFKKASVAASEWFHKTGQFSLKDIKKATSDFKGDYIPLYKLVKLLEHLNIIAPIKDQCDGFDSPPSSAHKKMYLMPCILQNASTEELQEKNFQTDMVTHCASLIIRYKCGFVPIGVFPAAIANIIGQKSLKLIVKGIKKNRVQFQFSPDRDLVTLISQPKYYKIHIARHTFAKTPIHEVCSKIKEIIKSTLREVTSQMMNYDFIDGYQFSFECPYHVGSDHLCVVDNNEASPYLMDCLEDVDDPKTVKMESRHLVWFGKPFSQNQDPIGDHSDLQSDHNSVSTPDYASGIPACDLDQQLDWDHNGVEYDLNEIADHIVDWERLSVDLGLKRHEISDISAINQNRPPLQRREALRLWKSKCGHEATYRKLLEIFMKNKQHAAAEALSRVLKKKGRNHIMSGSASLQSNSADLQSYSSVFSDATLSLLDKQLDWCHGGVDKDLYAIADSMLKWEEKLSTHLGLTQIDITNIKEQHPRNPIQRRREVLKTWKNKQGYKATYRRLLKIFLKAEHPHSADTIHEVLKENLKSPTDRSIQAPSCIDHDLTLGKFEETAPSQVQQHIERQQHCTTLAGASTCQTQGRKRLTSEGSIECVHDLSLPPPKKKNFDIPISLHCDDDEDVF